MMPLKVGLLYSQIKTGRANKHLNELKREFSEFFGNEPYAITRYDDIDTARHIIRYLLPNY